MSYYDKEHKDKIKLLSNMWTNLEQISNLAKEYQINDISQDNNLKLLQTLVLFDFKNQPGREGSDAIDRYGNAWELKTLNIDLTNSFSTNHHTNIERIEAFRRERWLFSVYSGIKLNDVYAVNPRHLEEYFSEWENKLKRLAQEENVKPHLNNPKIPLKYIKQVGTCVYPTLPNKKPLDPAEVLKFL